MSESEQVRIADMERQLAEARARHDAMGKELEHKSKDLRAWEIDARTAQANLAELRAQCLAEIEAVALEPAPEDEGVVADVTRVVLVADHEFETSGGGTRSWVRDNFLPALNISGMHVARLGDDVARRIAEKLRERWAL